MQQGIPVNLPKTAATGLELNEDPLLIVIDSHQKISIAKHSINISQFKNKMHSLFETRKNKQVFIQADKKVEYGVVAEVMAEIKSAGIQNIGLVTLPNDK